MIDHDFELEAEEVRPRYKTPPCPTCEGRGKLTRWRYHALCYRDRAGHITLFRHEKALQTLLENALKQSDYLFEEYNLDALPIDAPRCSFLCFHMVFSLDIFASQFLLIIWTPVILD